MLSNIRTKSVKGLSFFMIFTWFAGDLFKTIYFIMEVYVYIYRNNPCNL